MKRQFGKNGGGVRQRTSAAAAFRDPQIGSRPVLPAFDRIVQAITAESGIVAATCYRRPAPERWSRELMPSSMPPSR